MGFVFLAMGIAYTIVGLANRDKWSKQVELPPRANKIIPVVGVVLALLFLLGLAAFMQFI